MLILAMSSLCDAQVTYTSIGSGNWSNILLVWDQLLSAPGAADNVIVSQDDEITIDQNQSCSNLTIEGDLIQTNGTLNINSDLELETGGTLDLQDGITLINGNFNCNGILSITSSPTNYVELNGELQKDGETKWMVIDGSVRFYRGIQVYINEI